MDYEKEINELKRQVANLQNAFLQASRNTVPVTDRADSAYNKIPQVDDNTSGVSENDLAICDIAAMLDDLEQRVEALEDKE